MKLTIMAISIKFYCKRISKDKCFHIQRDLKKLQNKNNNYSNKLDLETSKHLLFFNIIAILNEDILCRDRAVGRYLCCMQINLTHM